MPRYLISFDDGSMDHIPEEDWPAVGEAAHAVVRDAKAAGIWIFGGGVQRQQSCIVATDGTVTDGPVPETKSVVGGFSIIEVPSREEALAWAAQIAKACRCPQEVREIMLIRSSKLTCWCDSGATSAGQTSGVGRHPLRGVGSSVEWLGSGLGLLDAQVHDARD